MPVIEAEMKAEGFRFAVIVSRFNSFITSKLEEGAVDTLLRHGAKEDEVVVVRCPGAFEVPLVAKRLAESSNYDAVICLGAVIRGSTSHYDHVCDSVTRGVEAVALQTGVPTIFGVITTESIEQAIERAGTKAGNKGNDAAMAAIEMVNLLPQL